MKINTNQAYKYMLIKSKENATAVFENSKGEIFNAKIGTYRGLPMMFVENGKQCGIFEATDFNYRDFFKFIGSEEELEMKSFVFFKEPDPEVSVTVVVSGGMVQDAYASVPTVSLTIIDCDGNTNEELDEAEKALEKLKSDIEDNFVTQIY